MFIKKLAGFLVFVIIIATIGYLGYKVYEKLTSSKADLSTKPPASTASAKTLDPISPVSITNYNSLMFKNFHKNNLCITADTNGNTLRDNTLLTYSRCNPSSNKQIFSYDVSTNIIKSIIDPSYCVSFVENNDIKKLYLKNCDNSNSQKFKYDASYGFIKSVSLAGNCIDDNDMFIPDPSNSGFKIWGCDRLKKSQIFYPYAQANFPVYDPPNFKSNGKQSFMIIDYSSNLCLSDDSANTEFNSTNPKYFSMTKCVADPSSQVFTFWPGTNQISKKKSDNLCFDANGATTSNNNKLVYKNCIDPSKDSLTSDQTFLYVPANKQIKNGNSENLCLTRDTTNNVTFAECNTADTKQNFEVYFI